MPVFKYKDKETGEWVAVIGGSSDGVDIPASDTEPENGNFWLDTSEESGKFYNAAEVDALLQQMKEEILGSIPEIPVSSGVQMELLWKNDKPTEAFAAQTISLPSNTYDEILIYTVVGSVSFVACVYDEYDGRLYEHDNANYYRQFVFTNNTLVFEDCKMFSGGTSSAHNTACKPHKIYGIKGVEIL